MSFGWAEREFDRRASTYDQSSMHIALADAAARFAAPVATETVLDIATGTGLVLRGFSRMPPDRLTGIDVSTAMLEVAASALPGARFLQADASHLPFESGEFDLITCISAMPYLGDPVEAVREWRRVLAVDGRIVASAFTLDGLTGPTLLRRAARQHGFTVDDPNEPTATIEAWHAIAASSTLRVTRFAEWTAQLPSTTVESLLRFQYPFSTRNDLSEATREELALVESSLREQVAETEEWKAQVLLIELCPLSAMR